MGDADDTICRAARFCDDGAGLAGDPAEARALYQDLLDRINQAGFSGDATAFLEAMHTPHRIRTLDTAQVLDTPDDMRRLFRGFCDFLAEHRVTSYVRVCTDARFVDPDTVVGAHLSHVLCGPDYVLPRFRVQTVLRRIAGRWKLTETETLIHDDAGLPAFLGHGRADAPKSREG